MLKHTHTYSSDYDFDESTHWHPSTCGHDVKDSVASHIFTDWVIEKKSTTTETGLQSRTCTVCNYKETKKISKINTYTITWCNDDGTVLERDINVEENTIPFYDGLTPTKDKTQEYTYSFIGWDRTIEKATKDITYTAVYSQTKNKYTITFVNYDNSILSISLVDYGIMPNIPSNPTKESDNVYFYTFTGWDKEVSEVVEDTVYKACYESTYKDFNITFNSNGGTEFGTLSLQGIKYLL